MTKTLSEYFQIKRRYSRSINLDRDLEDPEALNGYVLTEQSQIALKRIISQLNNGDGPSAWTLTSVYGTGKSAFAHFLACLCTDSKKPVRSLAWEIALAQDLTLIDTIPNIGYVMAVTTAQREAIAITILRALQNGLDKFSRITKQKKLKLIEQINNLLAKLELKEVVNSKEIIKLIQLVVQTAKTGVFFIIDELGKNLEYAAHTQGKDDLYLLQQLAELPKAQNKIYFLGILHQAFAEYAQRLAVTERNEWAKIQGRFEDITFTQSNGETTRLIAQVIDQSQAQDILGDCNQNNIYELWLIALKQVITNSEFTREKLRSLYPLHPITALVLPSLCYRYAQNDRSLFTFLTSSEPDSLKNFLDEFYADQFPLPTLKLDRLYDYFVESATKNLGSRFYLQRWVEIQALINDYQHLELDVLKLLKTIAILNLVTTTGALRATPELVSLAMCENPTEDNLKVWVNLIEQYSSSGPINYRKQLNELRLWEGSDFNVDKALSEYLEENRIPSAEKLSQLRPLKPKIAQRHSYKTGTLRYFERRYLDSSENLDNLSCKNQDSDGLIIYWIGEPLQNNLPSATTEGKPLIILCTTQLDLLTVRLQELAALEKIKNTAAELQSDGVARREVAYRIDEAQRLLDETLEQAFDLASGYGICWINGEKIDLKSNASFNLKLSETCDRFYPQTPIIWNELINRRELTNVATKARKELIEAMLSNPHLERLGLTGYGPEVSMYYSLLGESKIHRVEGDEWGFYPPPKKSRLYYLWEAIESFCLQAQTEPRNILELYQLLARPPYGVKSGAIPVILTAVLQHYVDEIGVYKNGTFIPVLGIEHFELLLKTPDRYGVKHFQLTGLKGEVFKELEEIFRHPQAKKTKKLRNATLLSVVAPLYQFVNKLPAYTKKTKRMKPEAIATLKALQDTVEPDELLFSKLPLACNLKPLIIAQDKDSNIAKTLRDKLTTILKEINQAYDKLLEDCQNLLYSAFSLANRQEQFKEDLQIRAESIVNHCVEPSLKRFLQAAIDNTKDVKPWLEAILMIVADKPPDSWTDEDVIGFEIKLADIARRFKNLEALQKELPLTNSYRSPPQVSNLEAHRITITQADGTETHRLIWVDSQQEEVIEEIANKLYKMLQKYDENLQQAVLAKLSKRLL